MNQSIVLGGGCFWGVQAYFDLIDGVIETNVGYANGDALDVTYEQVCKSNTGFIEVCKVIFDDEIISLEKLLENFWKIINPTLKNQQGNDIGYQYQSAILYLPKDKSKFLPIILNSKKLQQKKYSQPITTIIGPLTNYVIAENYHQKYLQKNPQGYCHITLPKKNK